MKPLKVILIIILTGLACLFVGVLAYGLRGGEFSRLTFGRYGKEARQEQQLDAEAIDKIMVDYAGSGSDIEIKESSSDKIVIVATEYSSAGNVPEESVSITEKDGTLQIRKNKRGRFSIFPVFFSRRLEIYLPEDCKAELYIEATSSDVTAEKELETDGMIRIALSSGNIRLYGVKAQQIDLSTRSGNIRTDNLYAEDSLYAEASSGNIKLSDIKAKAAKIQTSSGNLSIEDADIQGSVSASSGDIKVENLSMTGDMYVEARSGNVSISVDSETEYIGEARAGSGSIRVEANRNADKDDDQTWQVGSRPEHKLRIKTSSGNIRVTEY